MGRGLSPVQRSILALAQDNRAAGKVGSNGIDLYYGEIYISVYDFPPPRYQDVRSHPGSQHWSRDQIGRERYAAAVAAVSRAVRRLEERGLVERFSGAISHWSGLRLTDDGADPRYRFSRCQVGTEVTDTANGSVEGQSTLNATDTPIGSVGGRSASDATVSARGAS